MFIKIEFILQAVQLIICHPKSRIYENIQTVIPRNEQNMFIVILLSFFITYFANFIYSELPNSIPAEAYLEPCQRFDMQFLAKIVPEAHSERSQTSKMMELFEKIFFRRPLFQLFTIYTKSSSMLDVQLCSEYASETVNYFRKTLHFDV